MESPNVCGRKLFEFKTWRTKYQVPTLHKQTTLRASTLRSQKQASYKPKKLYKSEMFMDNKKFRSRKQQLLYDMSLAGKYQRLLKKNPFLYFGLPFCSMIVLGSYWLQDFTALKYEQADRKVQEINEEDIVKMKNNQHKFDMKEEYYRLQGLQEEDWEPVRVPRIDGESDNVW
ncbi:Cox16p NDAI_0I02110 [Naumovozyma dairenensis CBS 421]|uniref:Cytochrome c oxidase assembly protein COX16, mitochondrial n=1 Tax=Naumovozyma dairenensis (strain ATCC 10597 / BCRC 20456 / CBS 421 / NBRC 0211 / NRRL Y-12639) TaxID=1071378 RepID=G0WG69_NAUDC|nr:hypothetical protein NDAI_0I02110 [Naumovozyma dairenensis CBS 421]CCD26780.1 hypothetical protein NDAI_0I02110 [Naumovozyma dairenensis CBS 421]